MMYIALSSLYCNAIILSGSEGYLCRRMRRMSTQRIVETVVCSVVIATVLLLETDLYGPLEEDFSKSLKRNATYLLPGLYSWWDFYL